MYGVYLCITLCHKNVLLCDEREYSMLPYSIENQKCHRQGHGSVGGRRRSRTALAAQSSGVSVVRGVEEERPLLHNVAGMASGVHALDDVDSASLGVDSVSLFADRLLVRGKLERSLSSAMRRRLMDAPLIPHFLMALAVAWQTADSELDLQLDSPSSLPRCSSELSSTATVSSTQTSLHGPCL